MSHIKILPLYWIRTADLWYQKPPFCQLYQSTKKPLFRLFSFFAKSFRLSWIRTRIVGVEGELADHHVHQVKDVHQAEKCQRK